MVRHFGVLVFKKEISEAEIEESLTAALKG